MTQPPFVQTLATRKQLIGMIHLEALPGTPRSNSDIADIVDHACHEAETYLRQGVTTVMIENMHDVPYVRQVGPEITAIMTRVACRLVQMGVTLGVQILAGANREALAVALAAGAAFVRVEGFVYGHIADEGYIDACAGELLRYRRSIGADHIAVLADIKKKHCAHAITADVDLEETARTAEYFLADGVIVTGTRTGEPADPEDVRTTREAVRCPVLVGSGVTPDNVARVLPACDGVIVGSWIKQQGHWAHPLDPERLACMVEAFHAAE